MKAGAPEGAHLDVMPTTFPARRPAVTPFLKWPGGKRWLAPIVARALHPEIKGRYYEPFVGSGAVHLALEYPRAVLSDANAELIETLVTTAADPEAVVRATWRFTNTADCYYRVRQSRPRTYVGRAARFIYLNRTSWGGVYRVNRDGQFNVPFANNQRPICRLEPVTRAATLFQRATLMSSDFEAVLDLTRDGDVVYADPPYVGRADGPEGFDRYHKRRFTWDDQCRLATALHRAVARGVFVALSARAGLGIEALYPGWYSTSLSRICRVARDRQSRKQYDEVVLTSKVVDQRILAQAPAQTLL